MPFSDEQLAAVDSFLAQHAGDDAPLVKTLLTAGELSTGNPAARSPKGARGLMQLTPPALKDLGIDPATFNYDSPSESLKAGIAYVRLLRERYGFTNPLQIAAAYNAGPGAVKRAVEKGGTKFLPDETRAYVERVAAALPAAAPQAQEAPQALADDVAAGGSTTAPAVAAALAGQAEPPMPGEEAPLPTAAAIPPSPPINLPAPPQATLAGTVLAAPVRAVAGMADLGRAAVIGPSAMRNFETPVTDAANTVLPPPAQTAGQRYVDAAAQGTTLGVPGGPPGMAIGAAAGVVGEGLSDVAERLGLPRIVGGVIGGLAVGGAQAGVRGALAGRAATRVARQELDDATLALERARIDKVGRLRTAEDAARERVTSAKEAAGRQVAQAETQAAADVKRASQARDAAVTSATTRASRSRMAVDEANASIERALDDFFIKETSPVERAGVLRRVVQDRRDAIHTYVSEKYDNFLGRVDALGFHVPTWAVRESAEQVTDDLMAIGLPREGAGAQARSILATMTKTRLTFREAQAVQSALGAYAFKAKNPVVKARFLAMRDEADAALAKALPTKELKDEFRQLKAYRRAEGRLFQNKFVRRALADTDEGQAVATAYITDLLNGPWSSSKQIGLREIMVAADDGGRQVMKDALLRRAMAEATTKTGVDWGEFGTLLRDPNGLRPMTMELLSAAEQRTLLELADSARKAKTIYEHSIGAIKTTTAEAKAFERGARDTARLQVREAEAGAGDLITGARTEARDALRAARRDEADLLIAARQRLGAAKRAVPPPQDSVLGQFGMLMIVKPTLFRVLFHPNSRHILRRAASVTADSLKGQEMLRTLLAGAAAAQDPAAPVPTSE